jgi:phage terminase large subunit-like protein
MGKVYLPRGEAAKRAPWLTDFLAELLTFPAGRHDDQVDTLGLIGRMLDEMVAASVPKEKPQKPVKDAYERAGG